MKLNKNAQDLSGLTFGKLLVIEPCGRDKEHKLVWACSCECGETTKATGHDLRRGKKKSCGCGKKHTQFKTSHGGTSDRLYVVWAQMKQRCENQNSRGWRYYGGRGITVCDEWHDYVAFREWAVSNGYRPRADRGDCTIDRINVDGNYEPDNCRWVDMKVQARNKRPASKARGEMAAT